MNESKPTEDVEVAKKEKPKKDKLMKKFSFRAFSFGKKDKQKPQTAKDAEGAAAANVSQFTLFHDWSEIALRSCRVINAFAFHLIQIQ